MLKYIIVSVFVNIRVHSFGPFVISQFNSIVLTFRDWIRRMRPRGRRVGSPNAPDIAQITSSSVKFCFLLSEVYSFQAVWNEAVQNFVIYIFVCFQKGFVYYFIKSLSFFFILFAITVHSDCRHSLSISNTIYTFNRKLGSVVRDSDVLDGFIGPNKSRTSIYYGILR
jgi:hypothetical protein